jgi:hypothetical protein
MMTHPATFQQARVGWTERSQVGWASVCLP